MVRVGHRRLRHRPGTGARRVRRAAPGAVGEGPRVVREDGRARARGISYGLRYATAIGRRGSPRCRSATPTACPARSGTRRRGAGARPRAARSRARSRWTSSCSTSATCRSRSATRSCCSARRATRAITADEWAALRRHDRLRDRVRHRAARARGSTPVTIARADARRRSPRAGTAAGVAAARVGGAERARGRAAAARRPTPTPGAPLDTPLYVDHRLRQPRRRHDLRRRGAAKGRRSCCRTA